MDTIPEKVGIALKKRDIWTKRAADVALVVTLASPMHVLPHTVRSMQPVKHSNHS
jgi:hypothetical protein